MQYLPIFFNLQNKKCLVVGGGDVATRKVKTLISAGAKVHIVAPLLSAALNELLNQGLVTARQGEFIAPDLEAVVLLVAATNNARVNSAVSELAQEQRIPVNVVDAPELCSFIMPSIIDRSPVMIAISSGGASPVLARLLRSKIETMIPAAYGRLAILLKKYREKAKLKFSNVDERRRFWEKVIQGPIAELMYSGQEKTAAKALEQAVSDATMPASNRGEVYLVGAGPGDPDLLTFRALRLLQQADVVIYDRLVTAPILELARRDADKIYVGKKKSAHTLPQEKINELLVRLAQEGKRVLRLKGGDPFIFGRGGEEIETLMSENIRFQVVPGVTAASGCAAYAGIPLTHRDYAQSVVFATGHLENNSIDLNWQALVQQQQTLVFYMGLTGVETICKELIKHGMSQQTPIALIERGTTHDQVVHIADLATMPQEVKLQSIKPPTLIIVGEVVTLHEKLSWYQPLT